MVFFLYYKSKFNNDDMKVDIVWVEKNLVHIPQL